MAIPVLPLNEMSVEEKLETMETIWASLSANPAAIESPAWHEEEPACARSWRRIWRSEVRRLGKGENGNPPPAFARMSSDVQEIEQSIRSLPGPEVAQLREWLENFLEDQYWVLAVQAS